MLDLPALLLCASHEGTRRSYFLNQADLELFALVEKPALRSVQQLCAPSKVCYRSVDLVPRQTLCSRPQTADELFALLMLFVWHLELGLA